MPSVTFGYTFNHRAPQNRASYSSNTLNISGQMNLFNGMQDFYTYKKSKTNIKIQENNLDSNRNDIVLNTKLTYIKILENKESLKIAKDSIKLLELQLAQATQFYVHGISDKSAVLSVEVNLANAKIEKAIAIGESNLAGIIDSPTAAATRNRFIISLRVNITFEVVLYLFDFIK